MTWGKEIPRKERGKYKDTRWQDLLGVLEGEKEGQVG